MSSIRIQTGEHWVSGTWDIPETQPRATLVLAHGAGARRDHPSMTALARAMNGAGFSILRFNFIYTESERRAPDRAPVLIQTWRDVWTWVRGQEQAKNLPLFAGGRSMGGRMATMAAAEHGSSGFDPDGLILFAYPLHPPGRTENLRDQHLPRIQPPMLFLSGTRDGMAKVELMKNTIELISSRAKLHWLEGADHGFHVLKRSGRSDDDILEEAAGVAGSWLDEVLSAG